MTTELIETPMTGSTLIRAEIDMQISTAKAYPRTIENFIKEATAIACSDEEIAESCVYAIPRKDAEGKQTFIKGESIRLAEIAVGVYGNMYVGSRIIENDGKNITAEGIAWDLEKNVKIQKQVKRKITNRYGKVYSDDMQTVTGNAACSIAQRNAILAVIPRALIKKVYENAVKFALGDQSKLSAKVKEVFERFKKRGIEAGTILAYYDKTQITEITASELEEMIGIGNAIREGTLTLDKAFSHVAVEESARSDRFNGILNAEDDA